VNPNRRTASSAEELKESTLKSDPETRFPVVYCGQEAREALVIRADFQGHGSLTGGRQEFVRIHFDHVHDAVLALRLARSWLDPSQANEAGYGQHDRVWTSRREQFRNPCRDVSSYVLDVKIGTPAKQLATAAETASPDPRPGWQAGQTVCQRHPGKEDILHRRTGQERREFEIARQLRRNVLETVNGDVDLSSG
jgi:hypothetical protein